MSVKKAIGNSPQRETFKTSFGLVAATVGSAVGLGNIWRFPYIVGEYGGTAFLLVYLLSTIDCTQRCGRGNRKGF